MAALHEALYNSHTEVISLLLQYGADANLATQSSITALYESSDNSYTEIVSLLLQYDAGANLANKYG